MRRKGGPEGGVALLQAAKAAERDAAAHRPSAAQKQQQIAELEERAVVFGDPVKQSAQAKVLERKWLRFLLVHGEALAKQIGSRLSCACLSSITRWGYR